MLCQVSAADAPDGSEATSGRSISHTRTLSAHDADVNVLAWNKSSTLLASASDDCSAIVWSVDGDLLHRLTGHTGGVQAAQWCPSTLSQEADRPGLLAT